MRGGPRACCITHPNSRASPHPDRSHHTSRRLSEAQAHAAGTGRADFTGEGRVSRPRRQPADLRSYRWFGKDDLRSFGHRSRAKQSGFSAEDIGGKPVIAILNTWSDANPCHAHFRIRAEEVKRGVWQAGGFPMEIPVLTLGETLHEAEHDAVSQPAGDGGRGSAALVSRPTAPCCSAAATRRCPRS